MYDKAALEAKTIRELKEIASGLNLKFKVKEVKSNLVSAIISAQRSSTRAGSGSGKASTGNVPSSKPLTSVQATLESEKEGGRYTNTILVSCGASSGNFPVVGKRISEVASFLKEALNIAIDSQPVVNGHEVSESYVLGNKDVLEFVAKAGRKG